MQPVQVGDWYGNSWVIQSGLRPGDRVIIDGVNKVQPGTKVKVTKELFSTDPSLVFDKNSDQQTKKTNETTK